MNRPVLAILAALALSGVKAQEEKPADPELSKWEWFKDVTPLEGGGWELVSWVGSGSAVVYLSSHQLSRDGQIASVWLRTEFKDKRYSAGISYLSTVQRDQYNCSALTSRTLSFIEYAERSLTGETRSFSYDEKTTAWAPAIPGTIGESLTATICARTKKTVPK